MRAKVVPDVKRGTLQNEILKMGAISNVYTDGDVDTIDLKLRIRP